jgi:hypothetical protein
MSSHHPPRHCFDLVDFTDSPSVIIGYFTEGEVYEYDFSASPSLLASFQATPTGAFFNLAVRNFGLPYSRIS